jgi:hypothetical protein
LNKMPPVTARRQGAESLAIQALGYLAEEPERLERFLALSGLDASQIRAAATQPGFLAGVLDHVVGDETLLVAFAEYLAVAPTEVARAHAELAGSPPHDPQEW